MEAEPAGFDVFFSNAGLQDYQALDVFSALHFEEIIERMLENPTERNPLVRNLSSAADGVLQISHGGTTVYFHMVNPLVAEIIAVIPLPLDPD